MTPRRRGQSERARSDAAMTFLLFVCGQPSLPRAVSSCRGAARLPRHILAPTGERKTLGKRAFPGRDRRHGLQPPPCGEVEHFPSREMFGRGLWPLHGSGRTKGDTESPHPHPCFPEAKLPENSTSPQGGGGK